MIYVILILYYYRTTFRKWLFDCTCWNMECISHWWGFVFFRSHTSHLNTSWMAFTVFTMAAVTCLTLFCSCAVYEHLLVVIEREHNSSPAALALALSAVCIAQQPHSYRSVFLSVIGTQWWSLIWINMWKEAPMVNVTIGIIGITVQILPVLYMYVSTNSCKQTAFPSVYTGLVPA